MADVLLTVLMPVYNAERFLREAIDSILAQSLQHFEFLIIDDGSTDSRVEIIRSYTDSRIRFIQNEKNLGISATLNKGIELSKTELIARMEADDISYPNRLEKQYEYFLTHPDCALLSTWAREISETGETIKTEKFGSTYYYYILNFDCWIYHPTVMYKKSKVLEVGGYSVPYCEDFDLWWKLSRKFEMDNLAEALLDYRSTKESLSRVSKRAEYDQAHRDLILRNIHYYTGNKFRLTYDELECLRSNFEPMLQKGKVKSAIRFLKKFDYVNSCVLEKEKNHIDLENITEAMKFKRQYLVINLTRKLSNLKRLQFYLGIGNYQNVFSGLYNALLGKPKKNSA